jgi:hypothetical protein
MYICTTVNISRQKLPHVLRIRSKGKKLATKLEVGFQDSSAILR